MREPIDQRASGCRERAEGAGPPDLLCFSHLRWSFVYQRPQHLLTRCARRRRVYFFEEPCHDSGPARLEMSAPAPGVTVAVPHVHRDASARECVSIQRELLGQLLERRGIREYVSWYYTPMALPFTRHLSPAATVYDCMDQLSAFRGAPLSLADLETELFRRADVVLTGGQSLYELKRDLHANIHALPSSVDVAHFARARGALAEPADQAAIPRRRLGFFGVVDERMDLGLIAAVAAARPDWHLVLLGPITKIEEDSLPRRPNIHYLGPKSYEELPAYLAGWDVALLPFARNESTRFISPTKTPEYLAAGKPVVSTSIRDVVKPYAELGLVRIADAPADFVAAVEACLSTERGGELKRADQLLARMSWDRTWARAEALLERALANRQGRRAGGPCSTT